MNQYIDVRNNVHAQLYVSIGYSSSANVLLFKSGKYRYASGIFPLLNINHLKPRLISRDIVYLRLRELFSPARDEPVNTP